MVTFRPVAERGVLVEFAASFGDAAQAEVRALDRALAAAPFAGFVEAVPALVNLLVLFDPRATDHATAERHLRALLGAPPAAVAPPAGHEVAVCYDDPFAPDLAAVAAAAGLTPEAAIAAHLAGCYEVAMYGFAPGYAYLSGLPAPLRRDRKPAPLRGVPAGSVLVAGRQCLVSTLTMPTGWWILGRSPTRILTGDPARPFLFDVGDRVRFRRISRAAFEAQTAGRSGP
jgi:inhibitor of KinA